MGGDGGAYFERGGLMGGRCVVSKSGEVEEEDSWPSGCHYEGNAEDGVSFMHCFQRRAPHQLASRFSGHNCAARSYSHSIL